MDTSDIMRRLAPFYDADKEARERQKRTAESLEEAVLQECRGFYEGKRLRICNNISGRTLAYIMVRKVQGLIGVPYNIGVTFDCAVMEVSDRAYGFEWPRPLVSWQGWGDRFCLLNQDCSINQYQYTTVRAEEVTEDEWGVELGRVALVETFNKDAKGRPIHCKDCVWYRDVLNDTLRKGVVTAYEETNGMFTITETGDNGHFSGITKRPGKYLWLFGLDNEPGPGDLNL